jgi:phenylalanyl-tRNA synthetase beta chain
MKVSRDWLQEYFENPLPDVEDIANVLTFHAFEIEEVISSDVLDVNVLPDRAADCLSHRGIAREIGAVLDIAVFGDSLKQEIEPMTDSAELEVSIDSDAKCLRYVGAVMHGVKVGPSPDWLREALESVGQRSINNVVDATNYVMLNIGQPLHAFDAAKLEKKNKRFSIRVRNAKESEKIVTLTGEEYELPSGTLVITDAHTDMPIGIAGVKGGKAAEITTSTTDIIIESANFDGTSVRKASQALKLWTDASQRFQNNPSPELAAYGMRDVLELIQQVAGGEVEGIVDVYPAQSDVQLELSRSVAISVEKVNGLLGTSYTAGDVKHAFDRLAFAYEFQKGTEGEVFIVMPPFERRDITIPENLIEEVGRILGYNTIAPEMLPALSKAPDQNRYHGIERVKDFLVERGFTEISTQTFSANGEVVLANPLDQTRPALRAGLTTNMTEALTRAAYAAPRVLGPVTEVKLFEIGTVFKKDAEHLSLVLGYKQLSGKQSTTLLTETISDMEAELIGVLSAKPTAQSSGEFQIIEAPLTDTNLETIGANYQPTKISLGAYKSFSVYPFALRDIAVWTPERTEESEVANVIISEAGEFLARIDLFDRFSKEVDGEERVSYAFRLVFESADRTLSDEDLNPLMEKVTNALNAQDGWQVR